jgi:PAS domain S-box-containing protein
VTSGKVVPERGSAQATEQWFQTILDAAPDAMVGVASNGRIVLANNQTEAVFGYPRTALIGRPIELLVPNRWKEVHPEHRERYFANPRTRPMGGAVLELSGRRADGTEFPAEVSLSAIESDQGLIAIAAVRDVSERKRVEATFQAMLDAAPDAMIGVDRDGLIVMANAQTVPVFGYSRSELVGQRLEVLIPDRAKDVHRRHRTGYFDDPHVRPMGAGLSLSARRADGSEFPAEISLSWLETENGMIGLAAVRDITERRRAEDQIRRAREDADRAATELQVAYRELQAFSYAVAHDLRAPLRAIHGFAEALVEDHASSIDEGGRAYLERIRRNAQRMGGMIDALLELSRLVRSSLETTEVDLGALAEDVIASLREAEPSRDVTAVVRPNLIARGDRGLLMILVANLLSNAWKFTAPHPQAHIEVGVHGGDGARVFFVRDDGVGFDPRHADKLFTPFQRLHADEFGGSGIGLATAERIVRRHGGRIWADGAIDEGATVYFTVEEGVS